MKKLSILFMAVSLVALVSCGPGAEEKAKLEAAEAAAADSILNAANAVMEQTTTEETTGIVDSATTVTEAADATEEKK